MWHPWLFYRCYYELNSSEKDTLHTWKNHLNVPNVAKGSETNFIYIKIVRPPAKTKSKCFNALLLENVFWKSKSLGCIMVISIKALNGFLFKLVVKSLGKSAHWAFILKSNTLILTCPFKSPKRTHKWVHKTKPFFF